MVQYHNIIVCCVRGPMDMVYSEERRSARSRRKNEYFIIFLYRVLRTYHSCLSLLVVLTIPCRTIRPPYTIIILLNPLTLLPETATKQDGVVGM